MEGAKDVVANVENVYGTFIKTYFKLFSGRFIEWLIIYFLGYYNASFGWLLAPLFFLVLRDKRAKEKKTKFDVVRSFSNADEKEILQEIQKFTNLPSWVTFPDMERVEWLNRTIRQLWPYAGQYAQDLCKNTIEPSIQEALKAYKFTSFEFEKILLGDTPFRLSGIKVYDDTSRHEIIMDADFMYAGDCKFEVRVSKIRAGIKDLQVSGRIRIIMKPLVRQIPLVGGLQIFFLNNPEVDFNLIGLADVFDMPGLSDILRGIVVEQIANMMVLPNRYPIQLIQDINVVDLKCPLPAGTIRLHIIEAENLMKKDIGLLGTGKSDPYCIVYLGAQKFKTRTINNTVNPKWNYCCEFVSNTFEGQEILFELQDLDDVKAKDELLGRANLDVSFIWKSGEVDMWIPLSDAKSGRIHIKATWLDLSSSEAVLETQLQEIRQIQSITDDPLHSSILLVWVDSAQKLNNIPDPYVKLYFGNETKETVVKQRTNDPVWEEGFSFLTRNPRTQELKLEVIDQKTGQVQGKLLFDVNNLLKEKTLEIAAHEFTLSGAAGGLASVKLTLTLRVFAKKCGKEITEPVKDSTEKLKDLQSKGEIETLKEEEKEALRTVPEDTILNTLSEKTPLLKEDDAKLNNHVEEIISAESSDPLPSVVATSDASLRMRDVSSAGYHNLGRIQLTVKHGPRNNLVVVVHKLENLPKEEDGELPDPYVKLYLLPDKSRDSKRKTSVIKDSCNPVFDERFEYSVHTSDLSSQSLEVSVINKKGIFRLQRSDVMGQVFLDCGLLDPNNVTQWYELCPPLDNDD